MGRSSTPKYVVDVFTRSPRGAISKHTVLWDSKRHHATAANLSEWVHVYGKSFEADGVNAQTSTDIGYIPYPYRATLRQNVAYGKNVAEWVAPPFMVW